MAPKLYVTETSPPVRSVLITAAAIGLELEKHELDVLSGAHLTPEFLKVGDYEHYLYLHVIQILTLLTLNLLSVR